MLRNDGQLAISQSANDWGNYLIHSGNIGQQSVNYASIANNASAARYINIGTSVSITDLNLSFSDHAVRFDTFDRWASNKPISVNNANGVISFLMNHGPQYGKQIAFVDNDDLYIRRLSGGTYGSWLSLIHSSNIGSQSVNYANSAGSASNVGGVSSSQIIYGGSGRGSSNDNNLNNPNQKSGFYYTSGGAGAPTADWGNWITAAGNDWQSSNNYEFQMWHAFHSNDFFVRRMTNGGVDSWRRIIDSGNIGSQSVSSSSQVTINYNNDSNSTYQMLWGSGNSVYGTGGIYCNPYTDTLYLNGDLIGFASSDRRLKDNIKQIENPIEKIMLIGGYTFDWNSNQEVHTGSDIGVVAQEIERVLPQIVTTRDNGYKAVKYEKLVALLIEGIKSQQEQINELKKLIL